MIIIANKRKPKHDGPVAFDPPFWYIGRPSPLGNPYKIGEDGTREEVIEKYEVWLREQYVTNRFVKTAINDLKFRVAQGKTVTLVCWCFPLKCHGDVISKFVYELLELEKSHAGKY